MRMVACVVIVAVGRAVAEKPTPLLSSAHRKGPRKIFRTAGPHLAVEPEFTLVYGFLFAFAFSLDGSKSRQKTYRVNYTNAKWTTGFVRRQTIVCLGHLLWIHLPFGTMDAIY